MRRKCERGVSPVIATILMVAITVVLAAVLYVMVVNLITPPDDKKPSVVLDNLSCEAATCEARVTTAQPAEDLALFEVTVFADDNTAIPPTTLGAGTNITGGGLTFRYRDMGGEGDMTSGDTFRLTGIVEGVSYEVVLLWKRTGDVVSSVEMPS